MAATKTTRQIYAIATDGSSASEKALAYATDRAKEANARLLVVMVVWMGPIGAPSSEGGTFLDLVDELRAEAKRIVDGGAKRAKEAGVDARGVVVESAPSEDVGTAIVKFAEERNVATIFVGSHGRTGIVRVLLGSTADKVVKLSHCPVSVVR
jgi:nucleotide-binding universal stress UspA family protein